MPYASKATVQHEWVDDHIVLYVTFRHKMLRTRDPLASPPVYDVMPPLNTWLLDCDSVETDIICSEWNDEFTLLLFSDALASAPSDVKLEYDGPDPDLCSKWGKQWEPFGPIPSVEYEDVDPTPVSLRYPTNSTLFHDQSVVLVGGALNSYFYSDQRYATYSRQVPAANGNSFEQSFFLKAGVYTFFVLGFTSAYNGIADWYVDDVLVVSGQDWYSAANVLNVTKSVFDISISSNGLHSLKAVVNGKNASSGNYYLALTKFWFTLQ